MIRVEHLDTGAQYALIGTGYGHAQGQRGWGRFPGEQHTPVIAVCDAHGNLGWFASDEVRVVEIDGVAPNKLGLSTHQ